MRPNPSIERCQAGCAVLAPLMSNVEAVKKPPSDPHCGLPQAKAKRCVFISMNQQHHGPLQTPRPQQPAATRGLV